MYDPSDIDALLVKTASAMRTMSSRIQELEAELAGRDRRDHAVKIASSLESRGVFGVEEASDYAEQLASSRDDLNVVEDVLSRTAPGLSIDFAKIASEGDDDYSVPGESPEARLTNFFLSSFAG